ncbi:MAG TPA: signal peptide peptidase SppA [Tepidisphaeraceae bacterium]|jgi:protease-4
MTQQVPPPPPPNFGPTYQVYQPPRKTGCVSGVFRGIFTAVATVIFLGSLVLNVILLAAFAANNGTGHLRSKNLRDGDPGTKIAVIPLEGMITGETAKKFEHTLRDIQDDHDVKGLIVELDTPGGEVTASDEIYHAIERYKTKTNQKVVMQMTQMAASGGYYVAAAGDYVMAEPTTWTGSIGVLMPQLDLTQFGDKYGVHDGSIHSSGADFKEVGSPLKPETPEQKQYLLNLVDEAFARFKGVIVQGRQHATNPLHGDINQIANGKVYSSKDAYALGLIDDDNAYADDVYDEAAKLAGVSRPTVVKYDLQPTIWEMLTAKSNLSQVQSVNGVNVNVDANLMSGLLSPRLMYLCTK